MRRAVSLIALLGLAGILPTAEAADPTGFAFGRTGGNIIPYHVTIANTGVVRTYGPVKVGRMRLTPVQLAGLNRVATETHFTVQPRNTNCHGTLPDIAGTYVRVGARTVHVHGRCAPRYQRMLKALETSVRLMPD
jgi:hypothetical protein